MTEELNRRAQPAAPAVPGVAFSDRAADVFQAIYGTAGDDVMDSIRIASAQAFREAHAAAPSVAPEPPTREALAEIVRLHLTSTYHCTRVWEAWHVGTMTEDDFEPASESDMAEEIADAILAAHPPRAPLTRTEALEVWAACADAGSIASTNAAVAIVRETERRHGISAAAIGADGGRGKA